MKYRYLSIMVLILILSIGTVCAQDIAADAEDAVAEGSNDVLSVDNNVNILEKEISSGSSVPIENDAILENANISDNDKLLGNINENAVGESINVTNDTFFEVFNETGYLRDNITADTLIFSGLFNGESWSLENIIINRTVNLEGNNARLIDLAIVILSDNVTVEGFDIHSGSLSDIISIREADNVLIQNNNFTIGVFNDGDSYGINVIDSNYVTLYNNIIYYTVYANDTSQKKAIYAQGSEYLNITHNDLIVFLPPRPVDWDTGIAYSEVILLYGCDNAVLNDNVMSIESYGDAISEYDSIYALHVLGDNATINKSEIFLSNAPYGYGIVISGENFNIGELNTIEIYNGTYSCGIEVDGPSNGVIEKNTIEAMGESAYGIYTASWAGDVVANITENVIQAEGITAFGMSLSGSEAIVNLNEIIMNDGNYTTGIASAVGDITIDNNTILANGSNVGTPAGYDSMGIETTGIHIVSGNATVINNEIRANNKSAVDFKGEGEVTDNKIYADLLTGDFAVNYIQGLGVLVANNTPEMELDYKLTNDTFYIYFDEQGCIREQITADNLTFIGEFSNLASMIAINKPIKLLSDNATLNNIYMAIFSENVTVDGFKFIGEISPISVIGVNNVEILNNNIITYGFNYASNAPIGILDSNNVTIENNTIIFGVETNETHENAPIHVKGSDNVCILNNFIYASLPARAVNWTSGTVYSQGVFLDGCDEAVLECNHIAVISNNQTGTYDSIYAVNIKGNNATLIGNEIGAVEAPYGYAILISGVNFNIYNNTIFAGENGTYARGIEVDGPSNGIIESNNIYALANESAYGIYTNGWTGDVRTEIINNYVYVNSSSPFAMSLSGSESLVESNNITANGNYTTGIASTVDDMIIANNIILANGSNVGTPAGYDVMGIETTGVHIVGGDAIVVNNNITTTGEFAVDFKGTGKVVDNYLVGSKYTGDASVNYTWGQEIVVEDNVPAMERTVISAENIEMYYKDGTRYVAVLTDQKGTPLSNKTVILTVNGVPYTRITDENGTVSLAINLNSGNYNASALYLGDDIYSSADIDNNITVLPTVFGENLVKVFKNESQYYATFLDIAGNPLVDGTQVEFNINGVMYKRNVEGGEGKAKLNINLPQGEYVITATNPLTNERASNNITVLATIQNNNDLVKYYKNESQYVVTLIDDEGNPVGAGKDVIFNVNGIFYTRQTNESGQAKLNINLPQGNYTITAEYRGCRVSNNIEVLPVLRAENLTIKYGESDQFIAYLVDGQGRPYQSQTVFFNINGVLYNRTTDYDGRGILNIKLGAAVGYYPITSSFNGCNILNRIDIIP